MDKRPPQLERGFVFTPLAALPRAFVEHDENRSNETAVRPVIRRVICRDDGPKHRKTVVQKSQRAAAFRLGRTSTFRGRIPAVVGVLDSFRETGRDDPVCLFLASFFAMPHGAAVAQIL